MDRVVKRSAPVPQPHILLRKIANGGAALTLHPDGNAHTVVISPALMMKPHELVYHSVEEDLPKGMHRLHFDGMILADEQRIDFLRHGARAATLCPVEVDGERSLQIWTMWNHWRADHEAEYYERVTTALKHEDDAAE